MKLDNNLKLKHPGTHEYLSDFKWKRRHITAM